MTTEIVERITRSFESQSMMKTLGAKIHSIEKGKVVIEAPILPTTLQQQGFGHAGLSFSIGDSAAGYSALTMMEPDQEVMTAEIKMNLLSPSDGDFLRAEGRGQSRQVRKTSDCSYLRSSCPQRRKFQTDCSHAGNDGSCPSNLKRSSRETV